jgi:hypothetical protein
MARETALWQRVKNGGKHLRALGHRVHLLRIENAAGAGHPDVEGCINGSQVWIELKSEDRPARATTPVRPRVRESQSDWHRERAKAGCLQNFVLLQVGENRAALLYLIPGCHYDDIVAPESMLELLSLCSPTDTVAEMLMRASQGYSA